MGFFKKSPGKNQGFLLKLFAKKLLGEKESVF
jgi:hypothetical protein